MEKEQNHCKTANEYIMMQLFLKEMCTETQK